MTEQQAFLWKIAEEPACDAHRLVYADWLDEHAGSVPCPECKGTGRQSSWDEDGDREGTPCFRWQDCSRCKGTGAVPDGRRERAEFIRVQVELARGVPCGVCGSTGSFHPVPSPAFDTLVECGICRHDPLRRREQELWKTVGYSFDMTVAGVKLESRLPTDSGIDREDRICVVARGFVAHVACPLAALLGPCPECDGMGRVEECDGMGRVEECDGMGRVEEWVGKSDCPICRGSGLAPTAAARALFGGPDCQPVTGVRAADKVPHRNGYGYSWFLAVRPRPSMNVPEEAELPRPLFDLLPGDTDGRTAYHVDGRFKGYHTPDAAHLALGAAVVGVLRRG
jgi:uncharacterized protein (TIGR02996 family)